MSPSFTRASAPEHCEPMSWRSGSSRNRDITRGSSTICSVSDPLPKRTTSASFANSSGRCARTSTPFRERTVSAGQVISAFQPGRSTRLRMCDETNESISL